MTSLEAFQDILNQDNVDIATPDSYRQGRYDKVDK